MTDKRPWTEGSLKAEFVFDTWYVMNTHDNCPIAEAITCNAEADARLFAASPEMYEALHNSLILLLTQYETCVAMGEPPDELTSSELRKTISEVCAALRAANPSAFESEGE